MRRILKNLPCVLSVMLLASMPRGAEGRESGAGERLKVVATIAPLTSLARNVAGDRAEVSMLLPPSRGPHDFVLSPSDMRLLLGADVLVVNGLGLEEWLEDAVKSLGRDDLVLVDASAHLDLPTLPAASHVHEAGHGHDHDHGGVNPHVWLDPVLAIGQVRAIAEGLAEADPAGAPAYHANAGGYVEILRALDAELRALFEPLPTRRIITFHDAFPYFAARYGIEVAGVFQVFPGREPTPKRIAELRALIGDEGVGAVFAEPQYEPKLLESMAGDLGVPVRVLDPMGTGDGGADFYADVTRANARALVEALGTSPGRR